MVEGEWGHTFWFFKSLDINMVYTLGIPNCANNRDVFFGTPPPGKTQKVSNRHHYSYFWNSLFFIKSVMIICAAYLQKNLKP